VSHPRLSDKEATVLKKFTSPYRFAPAIVSTARIDAMLAQGAEAQIDSPGIRGYKSVSMITFRVNGRVSDQFVVHGNVSSAHKFVAEFNRKVLGTRS
jgi:hypothetical protein